MRNGFEGLEFGLMLLLLIRKLSGYHMRTPKVVSDKNHLS